MTPWQKKVVIGDCTLYLGDMRRVLPALNLRADMTMSDPPYRITRGGNSTGEMGGCFSRDRYNGNGELFPMVEWEEMAPLIYEASAENSDAVIMTSDREECAARMAFEDSGFGFHRLLVWDKATVTPNRWYMPNCEFGLYLYKGRARRITDCSSKALIRVPHRDVTDHPTEKPTALMQHWIRNSTDPGDLVLDPFAGSGSSCVAAIEAGRRAVGIELDQKWFEVACERVAAARYAPGLELTASAAEQWDFGL